MSGGPDGALTRGELDELYGELQRQLDFAQERGFCTPEEAAQIRAKADAEYERTRPANAEREQEPRTRTRGRTR
jgi:hypothetical protein